MSPTYTMSAHLYKQICSSWRQTGHSSTSSTAPTVSTSTSSSNSSRRSPHDSVPTAATGTFKQHPPTTASPVNVLLYRPGSRCSSPPKRSAADSDHED
ncbi:hypothetical protein Cpir12675_004468 [Ceratocystis pirilliformis]|uniref:Uncharacterized protein n=1 Tax=Ceratocystis pirilliformis TaxID=259994 RepID=A0ABR3YWY7_9PEZI